MHTTGHIRRLLHLIAILQSGRCVNARELAEECRVSKRTIFRDIEKLRQSGLRIAFDDDRQGYLFEESCFLLPADLTTEEVLALITLCQDMADDQKGPQYLEPARTAAFKLASVLPRKMRKYVGDSIELRHIRIGPTARLDGTERIFEQISQALHSRRTVQMRYHSFTERNSISSRLNPYCFFFSRRAWYVIGYSSLHEEVRTFHIKRFEQVEILSDETYEIPAGFSLDSYLGNAWQMIREKDHPHHVIVKFAPMVAGNVAEIQWHKTQQIKPQPDGSIHFHVDVEGLNEIVWWVLGYGNQAEVLQPPELRQKILEHVHSLLKQYQQ